MKKKKEDLSCSRLGKVGGQAVLEGVMMRSGDRWCLAVRENGGGIAKRDGEYVSLRKKHKFCNIPIIRGVINFVEMLKLSMNMLTASAEMIGVETDEPESKFEKWLSDKFGDKIMGIVTAIGSVLGVVISVGLFVFLPTFLTRLILPADPDAAGKFQPLRSLIEGVMKIAIFVLYIFLVGLLPDIKRTFRYHGAEHKSVACYEKGLELTPENAKTCTRFHPRCGTSFIFVMLILSIAIGIVIPFDNTVLRTVTKLLVLPITVGLGFEFIMYAGRHNNVLVKILSAPGLWMQRLTTKDPDESMLEVAITALKGAMPDEFPPEEPEEETEKEPEAEDISADVENEAPSSTEECGPSLPDENDA